MGSSQYLFVSNVLSPYEPHMTISHVLAASHFQCSCTIQPALQHTEAQLWCCAQTRNPAVDLPIGIVGSLLACSALYAGLALTLCLMARPHPPVFVPG